MWQPLSITSVLKMLTDDEWVQQLWRTDPPNDVAQKLSYLASAIYMVNCPSLFQGKVQRLRDVPQTTLERVVKDSQNPLAGLMDQKSSAEDVRSAIWELERRRFLKEGGHWDFAKMKINPRGEW